MNDVAYIGGHQSECQDFEKMVEDICCSYQATGRFSDIDDDKNLIGTILNCYYGKYGLTTIHGETAGDYKEEINPNSEIDIPLDKRKSDVEQLISCIFKSDYDPFAFLSCDYMYTPLFYACVNGDYYMFEYLMNHDYMQVLMHEEDDEMECDNIFDWFETEVACFFGRNSKVEEYKLKRYAKVIRMLVFYTSRYSRCPEIAPAENLALIYKREKY